MVWCIFTCLDIYTLYAIWCCTPKRDFNKLVIIKIRIRPKPLKISKLYVKIFIESEAQTAAVQLKRKTTMIGLTRHAVCRIISGLYPIPFYRLLSFLNCSENLDFPPDFFFFFFFFFYSKSVMFVTIELVSSNSFRFEIEAVTLQVKGNSVI